MYTDPEPVENLYYAKISMSSQGNGLNSISINIGFDDQRDGWSQPLSIEHARVLYSKLGKVLDLAAHAEEVFK